MGKRKRKLGRGKTLSSDTKPCLFPMDASSEEKSSTFVSPGDADTGNPHSSVKNTTNNSMKPNTRTSVTNFQNGISRSMLLRRSRNHPNNQFSHRASSSNADALSFLTKSPIPIFDERFFSKLANRWYSQSGCQAESSGKVFYEPERIRSSSLVMDATLHDVVKIVCGICLRVLKQKPYNEDDTECSSELSIVAILVCGHVYHADCLEERTSEVDKWDPPCPICMESVPFSSGSTIRDRLEEDN